MPCTQFFGAVQWKNLIALFEVPFRTFLYLLKIMFFDPIRIIFVTLYFSPSLGSKFKSTAFFKLYIPEMQDCFSS